MALGKNTNESLTTLKQVRIKSIEEYLEVIKGADDPDTIKFNINRITPCLDTILTVTKRIRDEFPE